MPECLMMAYADELPRLKARRQLDAADVALQAHTATLSKEGSESFRRWVSATTRQARRAIRDATFLTLNGVAVGFDALARSLNRTFGGGTEHE
jgi:hypothetical protein